MPEEKKSSGIGLIVVILIIAALLLNGLNHMRTSAADLEEQSGDTLVTETVIAHFAILNRGYVRPVETKSEAQKKYTKVGDGKIYKAEKIDNDDVAVLANIAKVPDVSQYLEEGETVVWYVCKKEADGWHVDGEIVKKSSMPEETTTQEPTTQEVTTENETTIEATTASQEPTTEIDITKLTTVHFAILNDGYTRPDVTKSEAQKKYTKVGDGKIYEAKLIENNDRLVEKNIASLPDITGYIDDDENVIWYVCKKEADGWHIDGEVVKNDEINRDFADIYYEMLINGDDSTVDIEQYKLNYNELKDIIEDINDNEGYPAYYIFDSFDYDITQKKGIVTTLTLKNIPDDYETKYEQIVSKLDDMLYGRKLTDKETVEFIKKMLQK
ncbi:hypothetical protein KQI85_03865 [Falcatimonas sp. MSJ-15]|uniref:hypothetical protein n=1 Tax=Falcatimonas sp. MSJ-15 TaxID=2841515 RepID=UPI001C0F41D0|nr:hypothetical protein [Falcatimonas sp. MSJ-15]MBU5469501.1 hypothetical protein [Falcatimonas sp. MSJ-15]